jgi:hypothetical protein
MPIDAIALLRIPANQATVPGAVRIQPLEDAVLVHTGLPFADEPEVLSSALRALLGDALLERHADPRGIFFIPDVAAPKARSYDAVIEEIAEGGSWGPLAPPPSAAGAPDLSALFAGLPGGFAAAANAALSDPAALQSATSQLQGMLDHPDELQALIKQSMPGLQSLLAGSGLDLSSPEFKRVTDNLQGELQRDPARLAEFAEKLFGAIPEDEDDEAAEDEEPRKA